MGQAGADLGEKDKETGVIYPSRCCENEPLGKESIRTARTVVGCGELLVLVRAVQQDLAFGAVDLRSELAHGTLRYCGN